jgi:hypothetical protein
MNEKHDDGNDMAAWNELVRAWLAQTQQQQQQRQFVQIAGMQTRTGLAGLLAVSSAAWPTTLHADRLQPHTA